MNLIKNKTLIALFGIIVLIPILSFLVDKPNELSPINTTEEIEVKNIEINSSTKLGESNKEANEKEIDENYEIYNLNVRFSVLNEVFSYEIKEGASAYDLMTALKNEGKITFESKDFSGIGKFITSINNQKENPREGFYWTLYINGAESSQGASDYKLKNNDEIVWKLETRL